MAKSKADASTQTKEPLLISKVSEWPGAFGAFKYSSKAIILNLATVLLIIGISFLANILQSAFAGSDVLSTFYGFVLAVASFVLSLASYIVYLNGAKGKRIEIGDALKQAVSLPLLLNLFILLIMTGLSIFVGLLLFIIPGLILLPRLILAPYFLIDQKLDCVEAYKASWNATKGHSAKIWGTIGAVVVMFLPVLTIIGIPLTIYLLFMYAAIHGVLYEYIKKTGPIKQ